jgi:hypothetical protein
MGLSLKRIYFKNNKIEKKTLNRVILKTIDFTNRKSIFSLKVTEFKIIENHKNTENFKLLVNMNEENKQIF